jgi:hypothetical protein
MAHAGEVREGSEHPDAGVLGQAPGPKRTSLQRLARHFNVDVEQMRAAVPNWVAWGDSSTTIDIANAKPHKVFELTVAKRRLSPPELTKARWLLREEQRRWASVAGQVPSDALAEAQGQAATRADQATTEGDQIRIGAWVYSREVEEERRARTLRIIERAQPGPFENGRYLELLAREAAAIEMYRGILIEMADVFFSSSWRILEPYARAVQRLAQEGLRSTQPTTPGVESLELRGPRRSCVIELLRHL